MAHVQQDVSLGDLVVLDTSDSHQPCVCGGRGEGGETVRSRGVGGVGGGGGSATRVDDIRLVKCSRKAVAMSLWTWHTKKKQRSHGQTAVVSTTSTSR